MKKIQLKKRLNNAHKTVREKGVLELGIKTLQKAQKISNKSTIRHKTKIEFLVKYEDALKVDWTKPPKIAVRKKKPAKPYVVNFIMSPPGVGSGGHQNIFRFIKFLEDAGHNCRIYLYSVHDKRTISQVREVLSHSYSKTKASIQWLTDKGMESADAIFATGWETAYPAFLSTASAKKFYFVQDFEPYFYPIGSEYVLAENTYKFGFYGVTAGKFLATKLKRDYAMDTDSFDFGADNEFYTMSNNAKRKEIFFYARPVTARRGFEMGIMALDIFHKKHPEYVINLAGWDVSHYDIPFPYVNLKSLPLDKLPGVYNKCAAGLVMSLTNMSLMPLELLSSGVIPVLNDGENNRLVSNNKYIEYAENNPVALANALSKVVTRRDQIEHAKNASRSVGKCDWNASGKQFVKIVEREIERG